MFGLQSCSELGFGGFRVFGVSGFRFRGWAAGFGFLDCWVQSSGLGGLSSGSRGEEFLICVDCNSSSCIIRTLPCILRSLPKAPPNPKPETLNTKTPKPLNP